MDALSCCCDAPAEQPYYNEFECSKCLKICDYYGVHTCRGESCSSVETSEYKDWYGITTGHWCDTCYETNYIFKKDRYPTMEYDGYGERLEEDY